MYKANVRTEFNEIFRLEIELKSVEFYPKLAIVMLFVNENTDKNKSSYTHVQSHWHLFSIYWMVHNIMVYVRVYTLPYHWCYSIYSMCIFFYQLYFIHINDSLFCKQNKEREREREKWKKLHKNVKSQAISLMFFIKETF